MRPASHDRFLSLAALAALVGASLGACSSEFKTSEDGAESGAGGSAQNGDAGATGDSGGAGTSTGGAGSGGRSSGGAETGGSDGTDTGGKSSGGNGSGGNGSGGNGSGGNGSGGNGSGGNDTGGSSSGGAGTGGSGTGGGSNVNAGLVINEVDYDNIGTDTAEFIEIYNASNADVSLTGVTLYLINGAGTTPAPYATVDLSPRTVLKAHGYLIYAPNTLPLAASGQALRIDATPTSNAVQNGSPDGIVLAKNDTVLDVLSYEGGIEAATVPGLGTISLVEKSALSELVADGGVTDGSLCRSPNGVDTNDSNADWKLCGKPTPGAANVVDP